MSALSRPSYFPKQVSSIPVSLKGEDRYWSLNPEMVLSEESAKEMIRSHDLMERLFGSNIPEMLGLSTKLSGFESLKGHGTRVAILSLFINEALKAANSGIVADTRILATSALLHDIGKLDPAIHDVIMLPGLIGKDQKDAWKTIRRHPGVGRNVVQTMLELERAERLRVADVIYKHHERKDGRGYHNIPFESIPSESQIITVADTMDVMMGNRPYKKATPTDEVLAELDRCSNQFNPTLTEAVKSIRPSNGDFIQYAVPF